MAVHERADDDKLGRHGVSVSVDILQARMWLGPIEWGTNTCFRFAMDPKHVRPHVHTNGFGSCMTWIVLLLLTDSLGSVFVRRFVFPDSVR
jgi:hypothetical protein